MSTPKDRVYMVGPLYSTRVHLWKDGKGDWKQAKKVLGKERAKEKKTPLPQSQTTDGRTKTVCVLTDFESVGARCLETISKEALETCLRRGGLHLG